MSQQLKNKTKKVKKSSATIGVINGTPNWSLDIMAKYLAARTPRL